MESDNTFEKINIILTTLKRKTGSQLSLNGCKAKTLSASAWKIHINISHDNIGNYIQVIRYTIFKQTNKHRYTYILFLYLLSILSMAIVVLRIKLQTLACQALHHLASTWLWLFTFMAPSPPTTTQKKNERGWKKVIYHIKQQKSNILF